MLTSKTQDLAPKFNQVSSQRSVVLPDLVRPWELLPLLENVGDFVTTLSLDCFDTLLWRQTRTPLDVFFSLANSEAFRKRHFSARQRARAESDARSLKYVQKNRGEVNLREIYLAAFPDLSEQEVAELSRAELDAEIAACFAFPQTVELIRAAKKRGLRVVVTSDTYFSPQQLGELLQARLPEDVYSCLDTLFCSSEFGHSKSNGLFTHVLESLREKPQRILHVGDNPRADVEAARHEGIAAVHFVQHQDQAEEVMRLSASVGALLTPEHRREQSLPEIYHGVWAEKEMPQTGEFALGYLGVGPIVYAFARFVVQEIEALEHQGQRVRPVFLMRDAHLPQRVVAALSPRHAGAALSISRFAAYAASFVDEASIQNYLARSAGSGRVKAMLRQLLVPEKLQKGILDRVSKARNQGTELVKQVLRPEIVKVIVSESKAYRTRFFAYLEREFEFATGDTLLFIDLGYEGTAQRCLTSVLAEERGLLVRGCYLMASTVSGGQQNRSGLLDPSNSDDRVLDALIPYIAVLEDLCTSHLGSVIAYHDDGRVILSECLVPDAQFARVVPVQDWAVQFAQDADNFFERVGTRPSADALRYSATASLGRLLFLPTRAEVEYLDGFRLDLGMGTEDSFALFDRNAGLRDLRRRGLSFVEHNQDNFRLNYPMELRHAGIELSMSLLAHRRFGFEFAQSDLNQRRLSVSVLALQKEASSQIQVEAMATHDGCFALTVPVGMCEYEIGLLFGQKMSWMQLVSMELIVADRLSSKTESAFTVDAQSLASWEQAVVHEAGVISFSSLDGFAFISTAAHPHGEQHFVLRVVFRPLELREPELFDGRP